jgi:hypothetical protein
MRRPVFLHGDTEFESSLPTGMAKPPLNGERQKKADGGDTAACDEERFENVGTYIRDVGDAAILGDIVWTALCEPRYEHGQ